MLGGAAEQQQEEEVDLVELAEMLSTLGDDGTLLAAGLGDGAAPASNAGGGLGAAAVPVVGFD